MADDEPYDKDAVAAAEAGDDGFDPADLFDSGDYESVERYKQRKDHALNTLEDIQADIRRWETGLEKEVVADEKLNKALKRVGKGGSRAGAKAKAKSAISVVPYLGDKIADRVGPMTHGELLQAQYDIASEYYQDVDGTLKAVRNEIDNWDEVVKGLDSDITTVVNERERLEERLKELNEKRDRLAEEYQEMRAEEVGGEYAEDGEAYELDPEEDDLSLDDMSADLWEAYQNVDEVSDQFQEMKDDYATLSAELRRFDRLKNEAQRTQDFQRKVYESVRVAHDNLGEKIQILDQFQSGITEQAVLQRQTQELMEAINGIEETVNTAVEYHTEWADVVVGASEEILESDILDEKARDSIEEFLEEDETVEEKQAVDVKAADDIVKKRKDSD